MKTWVVERCERRSIEVEAKSWFEKGSLIIFQSANGEQVAGFGVREVVNITLKVDEEA